MNDPLTFQIVLDSKQLDSPLLEQRTLALEREVVDSFGPDSVVRPQANKSIDPWAFAALSISLAPTAVTKFLEFLSVWAMRRENRPVKIRIQLGKNRSIEFEGSETLSPEKVQEWIRAVEGPMKTKPKSTRK